MYVYQIMCVVVDQETDDINVVSYYYISEVEYDIESLIKQKGDIINKVMEDVDKTVEDTEREYVITQLPKKLFNGFETPGLFSPEGELLYDLSN